MGWTRKLADAESALRSDYFSIPVEINDHDKEPMASGFSGLLDVDLKYKRQDPHCFPTTSQIAPQKTKHRTLQNCRLQVRTPEFWSLRSAVFRGPKPNKLSPQRPNAWHLIRHHFPKIVDLLPKNRQGVD